MTNFSIDLEEYILKHIEPEDKVLARLNRDTHTNILYSRMCSGHLQGSLLTMLSKMMAPKRILELGTFTGYSAICLAKGLQPDGQLHTLEINDELEEFAAKYFEEAGFGDKIHQHLGNAEEIIPTLDMEFDLIFMDADKRRYCEHFDLVFPKLKMGGTIIADNTLWDGKVIEPVAKNDEQTKGILRFNAMIAEDPRVEKTILPIRDGLTVIRKVAE